MVGSSVKPSNGKNYYFQNPAKYILDFQIAITTSHIRFYNFVIKYVLGCFTEVRSETVSLGQCHTPGFYVIII